MNMKAPIYLAILAIGTLSQSSISSPYKLIDSASSNPVVVEEPNPLFLEDGEPTFSDHPILTPFTKAYKNELKSYARQNVHGDGSCWIYVMVKILLRKTGKVARNRQQDLGGAVIKRLDNYVTESFVKKFGAEGGKLVRSMRDLIVEVRRTKSIKELMSDAKNIDAMRSFVRNLIYAEDIDKKNLTEEDRRFLRLPNGEGTEQMMTKFLAPLGVDLWIVDPTEPEFTTLSHVNPVTAKGETLVLFDQPDVKRKLGELTEERETIILKTEGHYSLLQPN